MSMKKAFDQTIRDLKREVNKKVLKVPSVEQKVLDATSNEPWGPHGTLLADIAQATRNYHEYQIIMAVLWKRINDTGKNWRHVYKALTVLEYLVAHGSERVIDDIREHAYQISTLSDFQYIDSSGRDQGNNVRRKSQSLVVLVNDKERIQEVRQKAASNRDKFHSSSAVGGMYRPGSGGDDRYEERNGYGREREYGYRDEERYGRYGDSYNREGDRCGRESEDCYSRDSYRNDESRGRSLSADYEYGSRSSDRDGDHAFEEDDRHSSRGSSVKAEEHPNDGRRKFSEQNLGAPPSYEEAVSVSRSPTYSERDGEVPAVSAPQSSSPVTDAAPQSSSPIANISPQSSPPFSNDKQSLSPPNNVNAAQAAAKHGVSSHPNLQADPFDEFDPRGSVSAAPSTSNNADMDLLGSLSDAFAPSPIAIMPASSGTADFEADGTKIASKSSFAATPENNGVNQSFEDPFGDSPFKAMPCDGPAEAHNFTSPTSFQPAMNSLEATQSRASNPEFANAFPGLTYNDANASNVQSPPDSQFLPQEPPSLQDNDILAGILPPPEPVTTTASPTAFREARGMSPTTVTQTPFTNSTGHPQASYGFMPQSGPSAAPFPLMASQNSSLTPGQVTQPHSLPLYSSLPTNTNPNLGLQAPTATSSPQYDDFLGGLLPKTGPVSHSAPSSSDNLLALVPQQSPEKKFETKSTVWADTLNRGLVNLNISGSKINPLSDIGIDFESLNRKEKRMEKPTTTAATSNVSMGKAMGSGSGIGRAGAGALRPQHNPMMGSGMGIGMGMGMGMGGGPHVGMGNYGLMNQQPMEMGMNMGGMRMNMAMGQGVPMQPSTGLGQMQPSNGLPPGSNMSGYNPMMGRGGYPQQPYQYGGGYR